MSDMMGEQGENKVRRGENKVRRRLGVSIFVDNVSRRIRPETLKQAFLEYGVVVDVYVAYGNQKRRFKPTVFAFVRFSKKEEAELAIQLGDGRMMDGFKVRMFLAHQKKPEIIRARSHGPVKHSWAAALRDSRTFKEVLVGEQVSTDPGGASRGAGGANVGSNDGAINSGVVEVRRKMVRVVAVESAQESVTLEEGQSCITINKKDMVCLKDCLVGRIKAMYSAEIVEQALRSDGFQATVCPWFGLLVILRMQDGESKNAVWALRDELMSTWFDELELLTGYEGKRRVKVWAELSDVPLQMWNSSFFSKLGARWGRVIKVDEETVNLTRFDKAKVLLEVQSKAMIPGSVNVLFNGVVSRISIEAKEHEEDPVFLDGGAPADVRLPRDGDASWNEHINYEEMMRCVEPESHNSATEVSKSVEGVVSTNQGGQPPAWQGVSMSGGGSRVGPSEYGLHEVQVESVETIPFELTPPNNKILDVRPMEPCPSGPDGSRLIEVEVGLADSAKVGFNSARNGPSRHVRLSALEGGTQLSFRAGLDKFQWWSKSTINREKKGTKNLAKANRKRSRSVSTVPALPSCATFSSLPDGETNSVAVEEAIATLNLGGLMGVSFEAPNEAVISRLVEIELRDEVN
ncbi:hypothetical protein HRI_004565200 [Hibiscus trionum]|uniref:RRM domain-containing protein n=1 Tax=Hibiscus trionum TaxID=183268 RepID=A0A9W7J6K5_HIBTR|nr:hypothetical protein HRI_004565200 [Hibiscus trionum]